MFVNISGNCHTAIDLIGVLPTWVERCYRGRVGASLSAQGGLHCCYKQPSNSSGEEVPAISAIVSNDFDGESAPSWRDGSSTLGA